MDKPKRNKVALLLLLIAMLAIAGCSRPECKADGDCSPKKCFSSRCESGKCSYSFQNNCCGNKISENTEDGKLGNKCTCPADYGKCEGKGKIQFGLKSEDARYLHYYCDGNEQCVLGVERNDVVPQNFLDPIAAGFFKATSVISYNSPFDIKNDIFEYAITLDDTSKGMAFPIELTKIRLMFNGESAAEMLVAEQDLGHDSRLNSIGDKLVIRMPLNLGYKPREIEEAGSLRYGIDYNYIKSVPSGKAADGTLIYSPEIVREKFSSPSKRVFFVRSE